jgi:hypothetical protein
LCERDKFWRIHGRFGGRRGKILTFEPVRVRTRLYLVLTPDFTIVAASDAYLRATLMTRDDILDRTLRRIPGQHRRSERRRKDESARLAETGH